MPTTLWHPWLLLSQSLPLRPALLFAEPIASPCDASIGSKVAAPRKQLYRLLNSRLFLRRMNTAPDNASPNSASDPGSGTDDGGGGGTSGDPPMKSARLIAKSLPVLVPKSMRKMSAVARVTPRNGAELKPPAVHDSSRLPIESNTEMLPVKNESKPSSSICAPKAVSPEANDRLMRGTPQLMGCPASSAPQRLDSTVLKGKRLPRKPSRTSPLPDPRTIAVTPPFEVISKGSGNESNDEPTVSQSMKSVPPNASREVTRVAEAGAAVTMPAMAASAAQVRLLIIVRSSLFPGS